MKKKKLKFLSLKKSTISNLNHAKTNHGLEIKGETTAPCVLTPDFTISLFFCDNDTIDDETQGCSQGCTDICNETFTCPNYSCDCNQIN